MLSLVAGRRGAFDTDELEGLAVRFGSRRVIGRTPGIVQIARDLRREDNLVSKSPANVEKVATLEMRIGEVLADVLRGDFSGDVQFGLTISNGTIVEIRSGFERKDVYS